jgi:hypothetical protein
MTLECYQKRGRNGLKTDRQWHGTHAKGGIHLGCWGIPFLPQCATEDTGEGFGEEDEQSARVRGGHFDSDIVGMNRRPASTGINWTLARTSTSMRSTGRTHSAKVRSRNSGYIKK